MVLILLPPSEGKTPAPSGAPVDLDTLVAPQLRAPRSEVLHQLRRTSAQPDALSALGVGPSLAGDVARNITLADEPAGPAAQVYTGVLYTAARLNTLPAHARVRAHDSVLTLSALWGLVRPDDRIPAYRLSMATKLGSLGALAAYWRPHLTPILEERCAGDVMIDARSAAYANAWKPPRSASTQWVTVKAFTEINGGRKAVSHNAKHARGVLTHHLLTRTEAAPTTADEVAQAASTCDHFLDVTLRQGPGVSWTLELLVPSPTQ